VKYVERLAACLLSEGLAVSGLRVVQAMPERFETNLLVAPSIQPEAEDVIIKRTMTTWHKRDWQQFYELARRPWQRHRPPRPVYPTGLNRVLPAQGFSLSELDDAGVDLDQAERLGLPVDAGRIGAYGPNVTVLRDFVRSSRQPL
jgi:ribosomal protein L13E